MRAQLPVPNPCNLPVISQGCDAVADTAAQVASAVATNVFAQAATAMIDTQNELLKLVITSWIPVNTDYNANGSYDYISAYQKWIVGAVAVTSLMIGAGKMALSRRAEHGTKAIQGLAYLVMVVAGGVPFVAAMLWIGDSYSEWILQRAGTGDDGANFSLIGSGVSTAFQASGLQLLLALFGSVGALIQLAMMFIRSALLPVVLALWPVAVASSMTDAGTQWAKKLTAWLVALVLYKPAAATIYAAAFEMLGDDADALSVLQGIILLFLAAFALPALIRFFVPLASGADGTKGAGAAVAGVATGAVAVGAAAATMGASGGAGASGAAGKSGGAGAGAGTVGGNGSGPPGGAAPSGPGRSGPSGGGGSASGAAPARDGGGSNSSGGDAPSGSRSTQAGGGSASRGASAMPATGAAGAAMHAPSKIVEGQNS